MNQARCPLVNQPRVYTIKQQISKGEMVEKYKQQEYVRFMAVGDMLFCCDLGERLRGSGDYDYPFYKIKNFLKKADFLYGNLETMITAKRQPEKYAGAGIYYSDPPVGQALARAHFKAVNLAHNHMYDFGAEAVESTIQLLSEVGVMYHGVGSDFSFARQPLEFDVKDFRIGMLGYCSASVSTDKKHKYVTCPIKSSIIKRDVSNLVKRVDFAIVTLHEGACNYPSPQHRHWSKVAVDAGAKLVISHHSHVISGIEEYNGAVIAYGLGDFVGTFEGKESREAFILDCLLKSDGTIEYEAVPIWINYGFQPEVAVGEKKREISDYIESLSEKLRTGESDKEYWAQMKKSYFRAAFADTMRLVRGEGIVGVIRKLKKLRWHHIQLLFKSVFRKS